MNTLKNRRHTLLLAVALGLCGISTSQAATFGDFEYQLINTDTEVEIIGYTGTTNDVVCPDTIEGKPVTRIGDDAFRQNNTIETITLPIDLVTIGSAAFKSCINLTVLESASVTTVGFEAFFGCTSLTEVSLPAALIIEEDAFQNCTSLSDLWLPEVTSIGEVAFRNCGSLTDVTLPKAITIGQDAFDGCQELVNVDLPSATLIDISAFESCGKLTTITMPSVITIEWTVFRNCVSLTNISFPVVETIGVVFENCTSLIGISLPASLTFIEAPMFVGCSSLESIEVDPANTTYSSRDGVLFNHAETSLLRYPEARTGSYSVPSGVLSIGDNAFERSSLSSITLPEGLTQIGSSAFSRVSNLTTLTLPASLVSIDNFAFRNADQLAPLFLGNAPTTGSSIFLSTSFSTVYYLEGATGFGSPWEGKTTVALDANTTPWLLDNGYAFDTDLSTDPNGDGVDLLTAYALDLDPTTDLSGSLPIAEINSASNTFSISYYAAAPGITYTVETTGALEEESWTTNGVSHSALDSNSIKTSSMDLNPTNGFLRLEIEN